MIEIIKSSKELSKVEVYLMTVSPAMIGINSLEDETKIDVSAYCWYRSVKDTGEVTDLLSILGPDKKVYVTSSDTFKQSFEDIAAIFEGEEFTIVKTSKTSKAGRKYILAYLDVK